MEQLLKLLKRLYPDIDFTQERDLVGSGKLDSVDIMTIITEIEETFGVEVTMDYFQPQYFESAETMLKMIEELNT